MACIALVSLLCLASLHACSARLLPSIDKQVSFRVHHVAEVLVEKAKVNNGESTQIIINKRISHENGNGLKQKTPLMMIQQQDQQPIIQGNDLTTKPSSHTELKQSSNVEFTKGQNGKTIIIRSMLGSDPEDTEENVDTKENNKTSNVEDIDMMDYAQPHRKPPIHNEKP
ncbi:uncharacterized protein LOC133778728 isoform X2 [Humulus lupulus]|uniref:uncharacterized protein LOC133778728 isoform X2 n=1 Tax=Humulus lupulus TaxID=3486 RepID=UPI002B402AD5|nr:uncharacterized protein LOC133778728 isoform X2 [Humulus lupulus]